MKLKWSHVFGALLVLAVLVITIIGPLYQDLVLAKRLDTSSAIVLLGGHFRWRDDGRVEFEGYLLNTARHTVEIEKWERQVVRISFHNESNSTGNDSRDGSLVRPWKGGEQRQLLFGLPGYKPPFYVSVEYPREDDLDWEYLSACMDRALRPTVGCPNYDTVDTWRISPDTEARWREHVRACCGWDIPPFDLFGTQCDVQLRDLVCSVGVYNYQAESTRGSVHLNVTIDGARTVMNAELERDLVLAANQTTVLRTTFRDAALQLVTAGQARVEARAYSVHGEYPISRSEDGAQVETQGARALQARYGTERQEIAYQRFP